MIKDLKQIRHQRNGFVRVGLLIDDCCALRFAVVMGKAKMHTGLNVKLPECLPLF